MSFIGTPWNWLRLSPSIQLMNNLKILDVSSASFWCPCKWRSGARKRHNLSLYGYLVFASMWDSWLCSFLKVFCGKTMSRQPIGTSLSKAAKTVKIVSLWNLHFVLNLSLQHDSMTSALIGISFRFLEWSLVYTSFDRSSRVIFSCA